VWIYPIGKAGLEYQVLSCNPQESRLSLVTPSRLRIRKVRITVKHNKKTNVEIWREGWTVHDIPFYFDGASMGIVFTKAVNIHAGQAILIDLPPHTEVLNLLWSCQQDFMGDVGTSTRGLRWHMDHNSVKAFDFSWNHL
jgi:hypothetical protein